MSDNITQEEIEQKLQSFLAENPTGTCIAIFKFVAMFCNAEKDLCMCTAEESLLKFTESVRHLLKENSVKNTIH